MDLEAKPKSTEPCSTVLTEEKVHTEMVTDLMKLMLALLTEHALNQLVLIELTTDLRSGTANKSSACSSAG